jgi:hemoglobin
MFDVLSRRRPLIASAFAAALLLAACVHRPEASLYERLGKMERIQLIANETVEFTSKDPRTSRNFDGINLVRTKASVASHLCAVTGGPCKYEGDNMKVAHTGMQITEQEFNVMDSYLGQSLDRHGVDARTKAELQALLGRMKSDIVNH